MQLYPQACPQLWRAAHLEQLSIHDDGIVDCDVSWATEEVLESSGWQPPVRRAMNTSRLMLVRLRHPLTTHEFRHELRRDWHFSGFRLLVLFGRQDCQIDLCR